MSSKNQFDTLISLVKDLGKEVEIIKSRNIDHETKSDGSPLTEADKFLNEEIINYFKKTDCRNYISEESKNIDYKKRRNWEYYWVLDPIDGTKEFIKGEIDYTINVALCKNDYPVFGVVVAPAIGDIYYALRGKGAFKNNSKLKQNKKLKKHIRVLVSKSHVNKETNEYIRDLQKINDVEIIEMGSSLKICSVAENNADLYPRLGRTMEWDTCAAQIILEEAEGKVLEKNSFKSLSYNKKSLDNSEFIAFNKEMLKIFT